MASRAVPPPVYLALVNTIILVTSSFTVHWATHSIKHNYRHGLIAGLGMTMLLGLTFLLTQIIEYLRIGFSPRDLAFGSTFYGLTGLHGMHVFVGLTLLSFAFLARASRSLLAAARHIGVEVPAIYWTLRRRPVGDRVRDRLRHLTSGGSRPAPTILHRRGCRGGIYPARPGGAWPPWL